VGRIVVRFLEETDERLVSLRAAVSSGDAAGIERAAHALKGIAGTVGANEIMSVAKQLEDSGRSGSTAGAAELVTELERAVAHARPIFEGLSA
jgi:HPt (histidine-containing phosphotransfer) domain-containing protein